MSAHAHQPATGDELAVTTCLRCGDLAEVVTATAVYRGGQRRRLNVGHCASRLCAAWFSLPDPPDPPSAPQTP